jgi:hypothetical protein
LRENLWLAKSYTDPDQEKMQKLQAVMTEKSDQLVYARPGYVDGCG